MKKLNWGFILAMLFCFIFWIAVAAIIGGCSGQRTTVEDDKVTIDTWGILRQWSAKDTELYFSADPNGIVYWIAAGHYKSKTSAAKLKLTEPRTGLTISAETE
jgi:hypothetical protein